MPVSRQPPLPDPRLVLSWIGAIGMLWLLLLWGSVGFSAQNLYAHEQSQPLVSPDVHVYATSEQQFSPRRAPTVLSSPPADQLIAIVSALFFAALAIFPPLKTAISFWLNTAPVAHQLQLATLNISRAPPSLR